MSLSVSAPARPGHSWRRHFVLANGLPRRGIAVRGFLTVAIPILVGTLMGHPDYGIVASLGTFAQNYGLGLLPLHRQVRVTALATFLVVLGGLAGALSEGNAWAEVGMTCLVSVLVTWLLNSVDVGPPAAQMPTMVCAVAAAQPAGHAWRVTLLVLAGALFAAFTTIAARLWADRRGHPPLMPARQWTWPTGPAFVDAAVRTGAGVFVAGALAVLLGLQRPGWACAAAAAVLSMGPHWESVRHRGLNRSVGTLIGACVALPLIASHPRGIYAAILLGLGQGVTEALVSRNYWMALVVITPLGCLLVDAGLPEPVSASALVGSRVADTLIGAAVAMIAARVLIPAWSRTWLRRALADTLRAEAGVLLARRDGTDGASPEHDLRLHLARLERVSRRCAGEHGRAHDLTRPLEPLVEDVRAIGEDLVAGPGTGSVAVQDQTPAQDQDPERLLIAAARLGGSAEWTVERLLEPGRAGQCEPSPAAAPATGSTVAAGAPV